MLQSEFEDRTGIKVSADVYHKEIESIYNSLQNLDKDQFCADYKEHRGSIIIAGLAEENYQQYKRLVSAEEKIKELGERIAQLANCQNSDTLRTMARETLGRVNYIRLCVEQDYHLEEEDREYIKNNLR